MGDHKKTYKITGLSRYAKQILEKHTRGTVHSVYRKTINLSFGDYILALQPQDSPLSPLSLLLPLTESEMKKLPLHEGMEVCVKGQTLDLGYLFSFGSSPIYDTELCHALEPSARSVLMENIQSVMADISVGGMTLLFQKRRADLPLIFYAAQKLLEQCRKDYRSREKKQAAQGLSRLLGLGIGLTPSGDDFLCGALAGLILTGHEHTAFARELRECIRQNLEDTVDISAAFLSCALEGQFSTAVIGLQTLPTQKELRQAFGEIGHSSGFDTLCGVLYILQLTQQH